jgi:K+/H+ antiporter YhaU regulatory subunit KhtT
VIDLDKTAEILERLERVEAAVAEIGHNGGPPLEDLPPPLDPGLEAQDRRLSTVAVATRYGVTVRTIERWLERPLLNFPKPDAVVNRRRYWQLSRLREWDRTRRRQGN